MRSTAACRDLICRNASFDIRFLFHSPIIAAVRIVLVFQSYIIAYYTSYNYNTQHVCVHHVTNTQHTTAATTHNPHLIIVFRMHQAARAVHTAHCTPPHTTLRAARAYTLLHSSCTAYRTWEWAHTMAHGPGCR